MEKIVIKIFVILISFSVFACSVYATSEENTTQNQTAQETTSEETVKEEPPTETAKNETMYVQERCNIRKSYSVDSDRVGGLDVGTEVTVVAEYSNGWYKINYDGGEAYIKAGILRSTKPEVQEETEETEVQNTETDQTQIEQTTETQAEQQPETPVETEVTDGSNDEVDIQDAELINEIGVLPEVGKNIADYLYIGVIILAIVFVIYVKYKF